MQRDSKRALVGGIAAGLVGVAATESRATVILTTVDQTVDSNNPSVDIDFQNNGSPPVAVDYSATNGLTLNKVTFETEPSYVTSTLSSGIVSALPYGETIGPSSQFDDTSMSTGTDAGAELNNADGVTGQFVPGPVQYIGVEFDTNFPGNSIDYGWIGFQVTNDASVGSLSGIVTSYAYDDSGAPITAGEVPEPSALALLSLGAIGLLAYRRRTPVEA